MNKINNNQKSIKDRIIESFESFYGRLYKQVATDKDERFVKFKKDIKTITDICDDVDVEVSFNYRCAESRKSGKEGFSTVYKSLGEVNENGVILPEDITSLLISMKVRARFGNVTLTNPRDEYIFQSERFLIKENLDYATEQKITDDVKKKRNIVTISMFDLQGSEYFFNFEKPKNLSI